MLGKQQRVATLMEGFTDAAVMFGHCLKHIYDGIIEAMHGRINKYCNRAPSPRNGLLFTLSPIGPGRLLCYHPNINPVEEQMETPNGLQQDYPH